jgi:hypothetical protein
MPAVFRTPYRLPEEVWLPLAYQRRKRLRRASVAEKVPDRLSRLAVRG